MTSSNYYHALLLANEAKVDGSLLDYCESNGSIIATSDQGSFIWFDWRDESDDCCSSLPGDCW